jgi:hypothetical protein
MNSSKSENNLAFDYHAIRLMIGLIALLFPWIVSILSAHINDSISWSYHTGARDFFVGLLFVIGAFLMSYKGHKPILAESDVSDFWKMLSKFWKGAIKFRIREKKHEEDLVGWAGGFAAWITAVCPTAYCLGKDCPDDPISYIHYFGAIILFLTTVYFCLIAFSSQAKAKIMIDKKTGGKSSIGPKQLRVGLYSFCGWGIAVIMLGLVFVKFTHFNTITNATFWAEAFALELFGVAWLIASHYLPFVTDNAERQKLF